MEECMSPKVISTEHFSAKELKCKCGDCEFEGMDLAFMERMELIRTDSQWNKPIHVSSAYRCKNHNNKVSSTGENGPHTTARAIDCLVSGFDAVILMMIAVKHGMTGVGVSQKGKHSSRFIHLDDLEENRPACWSY
jgi:uncharacterized protein YcbK (DUF882 family)